MDYRAMLERAVRNEDGSLCLTDASSVFHSYNEEALGAFRPADFLHLMCLGRPEAAADFAVRSLPFRGFLLVNTIEGSSVLHQVRDFHLPAGSTALIDCARPFSLSARLLPRRAEIFLIAGGPLDAYLPLIPSGGILLFTSDEMPECRVHLQNLRGIAPEVSLDGLLSMNASLHALLTALSRSVFCKESPVPAGLPPYLREMHIMTTYGCAMPFSLEACEQRFKINRYRLCREYTAAFGISPLKDLNRHRLEAARREILASDRRIQDIAAGVGFDNPTHFINLFRRQYGTTPARYRKDVLSRREPLH